MNFFRERIEQFRVHLKESEARVEAERYRKYKSPEAIQAFAYHHPGCTKSKPLEIVAESDFTGGGTWGGGIPYTYIRCSECKGSK